MAKLVRLHTVNVAIVGSILARLIWTDSLTDRTGGFDPSNRSAILLRFVKARRLKVNRWSYMPVSAGSSPVVPINIYRKAIQQ